MRTMNASDFKARCLAILDEVQRTGEPITILKRGRPIARLTAAPPVDQRYPQECLRGTVKVLCDIVEPVLPAEAWEMERR